MTTHFCIGADHTSESYELLTLVLRNEWGFAGFTETDMYDGINADKRIRAGGDISMVGSAEVPQTDYQSPTAQWAFRRAIHEICYTIVNSNAFNNIAPGAIIEKSMRPWYIWVYVVNGVVIALELAAVAWIVLRKKEEVAHPEKFAGTPEGDAILAQLPADPNRKKRIVIILIAIGVVILVVAYFGGAALLKWLDQM